MALMTLPFLFYLVAGLLTTPREVNLHVSRELSTARCEPNTPITHTLVVENRGTDTCLLKIEESISPKFQLLDAELEYSIALPASEKTEFRYTFKAPRGKYEWKSVIITASDPFGLFTRRLDLPAQAQVRVLPQPLMLRRLPIRLTHTLNLVGQNLSHQAGTGIDFWGVREYHPGDSLRWIHWRKTARNPQQLFTKEFEREDIANVGLLLDARTQIERNHGKDSLLEYSIQATAGLAKSLLQMGNRVSLLVLGKNIARVFPGTGKNQLIQILNKLADCEPGEETLFNSLKYLPVRLFTPKSMIILVSPFQPDDFSAIARLRAEGYQVLLVSPNPVEFSASKYPSNSSASLAVRAALIERQTFLWRLQQIGIDVIDWQVDQPLAAQVAQIYRTRIGQRL